MLTSKFEEDVEKVFGRKLEDFPEKSRKLLKKFWRAAFEHGLGNEEAEARADREKQQEAMVRIQELEEMIQVGIHEPESGILEDSYRRHKEKVGL